MKNPLPTNPLRALRRASLTAAAASIALTGVAGGGLGAVAAAQSNDQITINAPALYPEGLACSPEPGSFFVGSLVGGVLATVGADGALAPIGQPGANLTGLEVDSQRGRLLVSVTALPSGVAEMVELDLATGQETARHDFAALSSTGALFANDIAVDSTGTAYLTNTAGGAIYAADLDGNTSVFLEDPALVGNEGGGLNGIVHTDGVLLVGDPGRGRVLRVQIDDPTSYTVVSGLTNGPAIDGIELSADGSILAVVSNAGSVVQYTSSDGWRSMSEVARHETGPVFPTAVAFCGGDFWVLQAHLDQIPDPAVSEFEIVRVGRPTSSPASTPAPAAPTQAAATTSTSTESTGHLVTVDETDPGGVVVSPDPTSAMELAHTGAESWQLAIVGATLVAAGGLVVRSQRRNRLAEVRS